MTSFFARAWPSYLLLLLIQGKVIWRIYPLRDLSSGDTSGYFTIALRWAESLKVNIVWSPLYTAYYGTALFVTGGDVYGATILHRVGIVLAATLGVLALMRRILPASLALLVAVWWAVLPINFETLYEVHLFALLPILAVYILASRDTSAARGCALGLLLAATALLRNELIVATAGYGLVCLCLEFVAARRDETRRGGAGARLSISYGLPILLALLTCALAYWRSYLKYPLMLTVSSDKHTINMCQVYAFGHAQRHPEWTLSPWLECYGLMQSTFGLRQPSLGQMLASNPQAVLEHVLWNLSLTGNGFQVALFNAMSGTVNPDYVPVQQSSLALVLSIAAALVVVAAVPLIVRGWQSRWRKWFCDRRGTWLIFLSVAVVCVPVIVTQRPRPSYLFSTTVVLMAMIGTAVHVLTDRWPRARNRISLTLAILVLLAVPRYYVTHPSDRPLYRHYALLHPFAGLLQQKDGRVILGDHYGELFLYLDLDFRGIESFGYDILKDWDRDQPLARFLDARRISAVYVEPRLFAELRDNPNARDLLERPETLGWQQAWPRSAEHPDTLLLYRGAAP